MEYHTLYFLNAEEPLRIRKTLGCSKRSVKYPGTWFHDNPGKPKVTVKLSAGRKLADARLLAYERISGNIRDACVVSEYMYLVAQTIKEKLQTKWSSYGIEIEPGTITPLDFLSITIDDTMGTPDHNPLQDFPHEHPKIDIYLVLTIATLFRYGQCIGNQKTDLNTKFQTAIKKHLPSKNFHSTLTTCSQFAFLLKENKSLTSLLCAFDLFMEMFPRNPFSESRLGTIILRYAGCSGLDNIEYLTRILGHQDFKETAEWMWDKAAYEDIERMYITHPDEEISKLHSYFPYLLGLQLSTRSPYSTESNSTTHLIVHIVGTLIGVPRSARARMISSINVNNLLPNAAIIYLAHHDVIDKTNIIMAEQKRGNAKSGVPTATASGTLAKPKTLTAEQWLEKMKKRNFKFLPEEVELFKRAVDNIVDVRDGSVGQWVKNNFLLRLNVVNEK